MQYRRLGHSGLKLSALSLGSWVTFANQVNSKLATELMQTAYDAGVNFFDNAEAYAHGQAEEIMGKTLKKMAWSRDSYCISSKVFWGGDKPTQRGLSRKHVIEGCHASLKRLQLDYLDLFFCHRPDEDTPIEETVHAMHTLVQQGKILYWGTSEWNAQQIMEAYTVAHAHHLTPPTMEQPEYNMFCRNRVESEYRRLYQRIGLGTTVWSPLASGLLTGKYNNDIPSDSRAALPGYEWLLERFQSAQGRANLDKAHQLTMIASDLQTSLTQLAIAWCLKNPNVSTVILGCSKIEQLQENIKSLALVPKLTEDVIISIDNILDNKPEIPRQY